MSVGYVDGSCRAFLDRLATSSPEPGGGSVAALTGALGAGLVSMVGALTAGKEKYADVEQEIRAVLGESEAAREALQELVQKDTEVYGAVSEAMKMPKETEDQKAERSRVMQEALKAAADVPLAIAEQALKVGELSQKAAEIGNVNAVTDAGIGAVLAEAAAQSAAMNVKINLALIDDDTYNRASWKRVEEILARTGELREEVVGVTYGKLEG